MAKLEKIGLTFAASLSAIFGAGIGLICGILYAFGGFFSELVTNSLNTGTAMAFGALIGMPLIFAICGFFTGLIGAVFYNILAKRFGGITADFKLSD